VSRCLGGVIGLLRRRSPRFSRGAKWLVGANHPFEGLLGFARGVRGGHLGDGLRTIREPRGFAAGATNGAPGGAQ
jgi:hypothetical protein